MKGRTILVGFLILILAVLCIGILLAGFAGASAMAVSGWRWGGSGSNAVSAFADEQQQLPVDGPSTLSVDTPFGEVTVSAADVKQITVQAHKTAWGATAQDAQDALARVKVVVKQQGNAVTGTVKNRWRWIICASGPATTAWISPSPCRQIAR
jgi:hypothetical protein